MKRPSVTNILAVLTALYVGATCTGCSTAPTPLEPEPSWRPMVLVVVTSDNYRATLVRLYCPSGRLLGQVPITDRQGAAFMQWRCNEYRIEVLTSNGELWRYPRLRPTTSRIDLNLSERLGASYPIMEAA